MGEPSFEAESIFCTERLILHDAVRLTHLDSADSIGLDISPFNTKVGSTRRIRPTSVKFTFPVSKAIKSSILPSLPITVCALNRIIAKYDEDLMTDETAVDVKFMIVDWADPDSFIEMRHNLTCRSIVQNGMCPKCAVPCEGVPSWRVGLVIKEVGSGDATLEFFGWEGVAHGVFQSVAQGFAEGALRC